jgi:uracil-DNA glycosylase family 4
MNRELALRCAAANMAFDCGCAGNFNSEIAVVAEAPGEREVQIRQPLIGGSGKFLWDVLRKDGLTRNHVYSTNVVKRKLVGASDGHATKIAIKKQELEHWRILLETELTWLPNLKYIIALGNFALEALTLNKGITQFRGSVIPISVSGRKVQVICCYNPAHILREPKLEVVFRMDCNKLTRLIKGEFNAPDIRAIINPSYSVVLDYIHSLTDSDEPIAHDIETIADETACVGLANSNSEGMCINFRTQSEHRYSLIEERNIRLALQELLGNRNKAFIAQNGNFDAYWMHYKDRIRVHGYWFDTMLAHHLLYPSLPHNLGFITAQYTDYPYYKDEGKEWKDHGHIDDFWRYNVKDCCITRIAAFRMLDELKAQKLDDVFFNHVMKLQPHLVQMTVGGVLCDTELKQRISDGLRDSVSAAREVCQSTAREALGSSDYEFNPRSPRDLGKLFFTDLRLVGRGTSTDKENRDRMRRHPRTSIAARATIESIDRYLSDAKFLSTYANSRIDADNRFRCEYKQTGVMSAPGRLSSATTMWGNGLNMQNIPENAKAMFVAEDGYVFSYYDMSQIEARIVAYLADIKKWKEQFETARLHPGSYDAHCALAAEMFRIAYDDVPKTDYLPNGDRTIRFIAKRCRHGLNYRMQPDRLATAAGLPIQEAEAAYRAYHYATPEVQQWWDDLIQLVRRDRQLVSSLGRRWLLLERYNDTALDSIVAFEPQSINGDHTASVIYKCHNDPLWPRDARMCINIHDANIAIHREADGELVRGIMRKYAEEPIWINSISNRLRGIDAPEELIVPAEFGISKPDAEGVHRWSTIVKVK